MMVNIQVIKSRSKFYKNINEHKYHIGLDTTIMDDFNTCLDKS